VSAASSAAGDGVVFGLVVAFLGQEFGVINQGPLLYGLGTIIGAALVFGIVFGVIGAVLGRRYLRTHAPAPEPSTEGVATSPPAPPGQ
jgi:hypothetical protein